MGDNAEKYAQWIVDNKDKAGTPEFETVAKAYQVAKIGTKQTSIPTANLTSQQVKAQNQIFPESVFGSRAINMPTTAGEMLQRQDPIAVGQMAELANIVSGKDGASNVARQFNVNQQDPRFKAGELTTDIGAAFAVPASLGAIASKIPQAAKYAQALRTGGFDLGPAALKGSNWKSKLGNILMKGGAGVGTNVATAELTNPEDLDSAIAFGLLPAGLETAKDVLKAGGTKFMTSAVKPDIKDFNSGNAQRAIQTMLEEGINPTMQRTIFGRGLDTAQKKIDDLNSQIKLMIANSTGNVSKMDILNALDSYAQQAGKQLASDADLDAIKTVRNQIVANKEIPTNYIPVQTAQELKQGTYRAVGERAYGQETSAAKEAQKVGAKALKEGVARAVPEVAPLNKQESDLINMLNVVERKAYAALKNNPGGLATIAPDSLRAIATMADRSAPLKALIGRMLYSTGNIGNDVPLANLPMVLSNQGEQ